MLLELLGGELPWHVTKDRDAVLEMKRAHEADMLRALPLPLTLNLTLT